ncbi:YdhR family protein [Sodalis sp. RH21]|uniref:YdhR family protein n=1 Tax=unclassified Sodalis (in: enterobacteria) TaxID=2636512 RepID=UPI0039B51FE1
MTRVIAQVNYNFDFSQEKPREEQLAIAEKRADIPGFIWKVWLRDRKTGRGGGLFLFEDRPSADAWLAGRANRVFSPASDNITVELFDVDEELSQLSRAPLFAALAGNQPDGN